MTPPTSKRRQIPWLIKLIWFPVLLFVLKRLGKKHEWAAKTHSTLKLFK